MKNRTGFGSRMRATAVTCVTVATLVVSVSSNLGVSNASNRAMQASRATQTNVLVMPIPQSTLWAGTLDPAQITALNDSEIVSLIYSGLLKQSYNDKTGKFDIVPDLASSLPTISKNGLVYTFKIRAGAKFSDGTAITAQDFIHSFERVLDPQAKSGANYYLFDILGASDMASGKAKTLKGVKALSADTLQITLAHQAAYFLYALTYPTADVVEPTLSSTANITTDPSKVISSGPWMLKNGTWKYRSEIDVVPNPNYWESSKFKLKEIDVVFTGTEDTMLNAYKSGQYPMAWLPSTQVARYKSTPEYHATPVLGDLWYTMNVNIAPFNDVHFRRAVAYAIDRNALVNGVDHGTVAQLYCWYPVGIVGYASNCKSKYPYYNPTIAKQELAMAMKDMKSVPSIQLEYASENPDRGRESAEVQANLKAIGITISLHPVPHSTWISDGNAGKTQFMVGDWYDDYPDPQDFSDYLLKTGAGENWGRYSNAQVDALFAKGDATQDTATREKLYQQAQDIIMKDAPIAMAYQFAAQDVITSKWHGMEMTPSFGNVPQPVANDWANVTVSS